MQDIIKELNGWLEAYDHEGEGYKDLAAIHCLENAIKELEKYYTEYDN